MGRRIEKRDGRNLQEEKSKWDDGGKYGEGESGVRSRNQRSSDRRKEDYKHNGYSDDKEEVKARQYEDSRSYDGRVLEERRDHGYENEFSKGKDFERGEESVKGKEKKKEKNKDKERKR